VAGATTLFRWSMQTAPAQAPQVLPVRGVWLGCNYRLRDHSASVSVCERHKPKSAGAIVVSGNNPGNEKVLVSRFHRPRRPEYHNARADVINRPKLADNGWNRDQQPSGETVLPDTHNRSSAFVCAFRRPKPTQNLITQPNSCIPATPSDREYLRRLCRRSLASTI